jgi:hypothetical protein
LVPESLSAAVNDRIRAAARSVEAGTGSTFGFLCRCGCSDLVVMTLGEYDRCNGDVLKSGHSSRGPKIEPGPTMFADPRF